jgi:hypothetical protein
VNQYGSDEFEDPELSRSLGRMSGAFPDAGAALGQVQSRVKRVRQRRAAAWSSGALVAVVAVGAFALNAQRPAGTQRPASSADLVTSSLPDDEATTSSAVSTPASTVTTLVDTTIEVTTTPVSVEDSAVETGDDSGNDNGNSGATPGSGAVTPTTAKPKPKPPVSTTPGTAPATAPSINPSSSNPAPSTSEPDEDDDDDNAGSVTPATQTFSGLGGSMTVSIDSDGHLRMLSYSANAGYSAEDIRNGEQQVSIRFRNGNLSTRIRVEVSGGTMVPQIIEEN